MRSKLLTTVLAKKGAAAAWKFSNAGNLVLELDPSRGVFKANDYAQAATADGDTVGGWRDQSGMGNDFAGTTRPVLKLNIFGTLPSVYFGTPGSTSLSRATVNTGPNNTVSMAIKLTELPYYGEMYTLGNGVSNMSVCFGKYTRAIRINNPDFRNGGDATTNTEIWTAVHTAGSLLRLYVNGVEVALDGNALPTASTGTASLGMLLMGGSAKVHIGYLVHYSEILSPNNRQLVEKALGNMFGISLPF